MMGREAVAYNAATFSVVLKACAALNDNVIGKQVHGAVVKLGFECDVVTATAMLDMYAKCNMVDETLWFFHAMPTKDFVSWSAIVAASVQNDKLVSGIELFKEMLREGIAVSESVYASVFKSCAGLFGSSLGSQLHGHAWKNDLASTTTVGTAILDMYGKCGALQEAHHMFDEIKERNVVTWTSMVCAYAYHGYGNDALQVFEKMVEEKLMPDHTIFTGVLHACTHSGLVDEALHYLYIMKSRYGLEPGLHHYSCTVDALGRSGQIIDALKLIEEMPFKADDVIWTSLLSNCKMHRNVKVAEIAVRSLLQLDPQNSSAYVLLMWDEVIKIRRMMSSSGLKKHPGCSWIEVQGQVHNVCCRR